MLKFFRLFFAFLLSICVKIVNLTFSRDKTFSKILCSHISVCWNEIQLCIVYSTQKCLPRTSKTLSRAQKWIQNLHFYTASKKNRFVMFASRTKMKSHFAFSTAHSENGCRPNRKPSYSRRAINQRFDYNFCPSLQNSCSGVKFTTAWCVSFPAFNLCSWGLRRTFKAKRRRERRRWGINEKQIRVQICPTSSGRKMKWNRTLRFEGDALK